MNKEIKSQCEAIVESLFAVYANENDDNYEEIENLEEDFRNSVLGCKTVYESDGLPCNAGDKEVCRVEILMVWGGPAIQIVWSPNVAHIEYQDWGTKWEEYYPENIKLFTQYVERMFFLDV